MYYDTTNIEENPPKDSTWTIHTDCKEKYRKEYRKIHTQMFMPKRDQFVQKIGFLKGAY